MYLHVSVESFFAAKLFMTDGAGRRIFSLYFCIVSKFKTATVALSLVTVQISEKREFSIAEITWVRLFSAMATVSLALVTVHISEKREFSVAEITLVRLFPGMASHVSQQPRVR